jgi:hypothetical protein
MHLPLALAVAFFAEISTYGDTLPLAAKTKASKISADTFEEQEVAAPMVPEVKKSLTKKNATQKDVLNIKSGKQKDEPVVEPAAPAPESVAYIGSVDVYGTDRVTEVDLKELFGNELDRWIDMGMRGDPSAYEMQNKLAEKAKAKWDFAFADWTLAQYFAANGLAVHLTLDVVEKKDVAQRMSFLPEPQGSHGDPGGLLKQWRAYEDLALELVEKGELAPDSEKCVAFHCPFGHKHPKLKPFEKVFVEGAKQHYVGLKQVLKNDKQPDNRAAAAFVLPYYKNGKEIVAAMVERIGDPDAVVRNNVLRVLGDIAEFHRGIPVPLAPVLKAFDYPRVSDRSKALIVAFQLALHEASARELIRKTSGSQLLQMLASKQPDHRELAHNILRKVSGRDFTADDEKSWQRWVRTLAKDDAITRK